MKADCVICGTEFEKLGAAKVCSLNCRGDLRRKVGKEYHLANKERIADQQREYQKANRGKLASKQRKHYLANKESIADQRREYQKANKERIAAKKKEYYQANRDQFRINRRKAYASSPLTPEGRVQAYASARKWRAANRDKSKAYDAAKYDAKRLGVSRLIVAAMKIKDRLNQSEDQTL
jgi:hypothetical protein